MYHINGTIIAAMVVYVYVYVYVYDFYQFFSQLGNQYHPTRPFDDSTNQKMIHYANLCIFYRHHGFICLAYCSSFWTVKERRRNT